MKKQFGYNFGFKLNEKSCVGVTQDDLSVAPKTKESITKADKGNASSIITGHDITFTVAGVMAKKEEAEIFLDSDDILELALKKGEEAILPFIYSRGDLKSYKGNFSITGYSESSGSEDMGTYTLNCKVVGEMLPVPVV